METLGALPSPLVVEIIPAVSNSFNPLRKLLSGIWNFLACVYEIGILSTVLRKPDKYQTNKKVFVALPDSEVTRHIHLVGIGLMNGSFNLPKVFTPY